MHLYMNFTILASDDAFQKHGKCDGEQAETISFANLANPRVF